MKTFEVLDPATLEKVADVADMGACDAEAALTRASDAFADWAVTSPRARSEVLHRAFEIMRRDADRFAYLICSENGKSLADARSEVTYAAEFFRWYAEEAPRSDGYYGEAPQGGARTLVRARPVGVAAMVTPWNFPAAMVTRKLAPALAAGCTAILKPAAETPLTAMAILDILTEAGLPPGVVEVVTTTDASTVVTTWLKDERVRKVSFTGSTGVGRQLLRQSADRIVNSSMELGGNAPFVVTAGTDIDNAVAGAMVAKFRNGGQACTAANRIYVHRAIADDFLAAFGAAVEGLSVGSAFEGCDIGPLISASAVDRIAAAVDSAVKEGARVSHQGAITRTAPGHFYPPTVLADVPMGCSILRDEIFGPVAPVVAWDDEDELLRQVNDTEYGLAAYVFAGDLGDALRIGERIEAGMVGINRGVVSDPSAPFGGVKQSGLGREGAHDGLREYQETQYLSIDWSD